VITFVDSKMLDIALEQADNVRSFGLAHEIIRIDEVVEYSTQLWLDLIGLTLEAINRHDKVMRLDAEVRMHRSLPDDWLDNDNVLFEPYPMIKDPFYIAINTGQMILGRSGKHFLEILIECMLGMIPPDGDTRLPASGEMHQIEDELPSSIAIRLSKIKFAKERLCYDRRLSANCSANRGSWLEESTVLTHPAVHNWDWPGAGLSKVEGKLGHRNFINHFAPHWPVDKVEYLTKLLLLRNSNHNQWSKFAELTGQDEWQSQGWTFIPKQGLVRPNDRRTFKMISH
jgi:hypothetical protein